MTTDVDVTRAVAQADAAARIERIERELLGDPNEHTPPPRAIRITCNVLLWARAQGWLA